MNVWRKLRGLGKEIWTGVDPKQYIDGLRDGWDNPQRWEYGNDNELRARSSEEMDDIEREKLRAFVRDSRLRRNCPFPPFGDIA